MSVTLLRGRFGLAAAVAGVALAAGAAASAQVGLQQVGGGLNQPLYVTGAPGDDNGLYVVQRAGTGGSVGDIVRYDKATGAQSVLVNVAGNLVQDGGVLGLAFHPDYATNGLYYVTSLVGNQNRLEEYRHVPGVVGRDPNRVLLTYDNIQTQHTIDWIGFKPGATGADRNALYLSTGDGGVQADDPNFLNRGQSTQTVMGKMLRLDVGANTPDAYPNDPTKNFGIPANNPFAGNPAAGLGEILHTGLRNPWRASFDRQNGDLYIGDVGFNTNEEVDFVRNDSNFLATRDFGWASREGTVATPVSGVGAASPGSINPIFEVGHPEFKSITAGYVYRGPVAELQGKYIFGDFNTSKVYAITFDRDTDPGTFDGSTAGILGFEDLTATLNASLVAQGQAPISALVSFGEDNDGNLYVVSLGGGNIFNPALGTGRVFQIVPEPTTAGLLLGGAGLTLLRRRRRN